MEHAALRGTVIRSYSVGRTSEGNGRRRSALRQHYGRYVEGLEDDVDAIEAYLEGQTNECPQSGSGVIWSDMRPEKGATEQ
jgi:hypothetical protein